MERTERIKQLGEYIRHHDRNEHQFDSLYKKLMEEIHLETIFNSDYSTNPYLNNLRQTKEKEVEMYLTIKRKRTKKGAPDEFRYFVNAFRLDVSGALASL